MAISLKASKVPQERRTEAHIMTVAFCPSVYSIICNCHFIALQIQPGVVHPIFPPLHSPVKSSIARNYIPADSVNVVVQIP